MTKKSTITALAAVILTASAFGFSGVALAENQTTPSSWKSSQRHIKDYLKHAPGVIGQVTSVNGSIINISSNNTNYSIDASTAKILKNRNTIITTSDILVGDTIMAQGTVTGTNVLATTVFDGKPIVGKKGQGNFPGVIGIVSAINGNAFSVTTKDNVVYTVDATGAKIKKGSPATVAQITDIVNGDTVMVRGTVNGTSVAAKTILDGKLDSTKIKHRGIKS
jgi:hypothetical protein